MRDLTRNAEYQESTVISEDFRKVALLLHVSVKTSNQGVEVSVDHTMYDGMTKEQRAALFEFIMGVIYEVEEACLAFGPESSKLLLHVLSHCVTPEKEDMTFAEMEREIVECKSLKGAANLLLWASTNKARTQKALRIAYGLSSDEPEDKRFHADVLYNALHEAYAQEFSSVWKRIAASISTALERDILPVQVLETYEEFEDRVRIQKVPSDLVRALLEGSIPEAQVNVIREEGPQEPGEPGIDDLWKRNPFNPGKGEA